MNQNTKSQQLRGIVDLLVDSFVKGDKDAVVALVDELVEIMLSRNPRQALAKS
jgi:hypothetical protein